MTIRTMFHRATLLALGGTLLAAINGPAQATNVGVSVTIGEPGFYGTIDPGSYPRPQVIYAQPVIVHRPRVVPEPVYVRVPPGYEKHWSRHCNAYHACGRPVYFVQDRWYRDTYAPAYRRDHGRGEWHHDGDGHHDEGHGPGGHGPGDDHGHGRGNGHD